MWTVIYIAPNLGRAELLKEILVSEGLMVRLRSAGIPQSGNEGAVEILVPESETEEAHEILSSVVII